MMEAKATWAKALGGQDSQETGGKGDMLMGEREMDTSCQVTRLQDKMQQKGFNTRATLR